MKIPWKGLGILVVLFVAIFFDLPTIRMYMPNDDASQKEQLVQNLNRMKTILEPLQKMQLALTEVDDNQIRIMADKGFVYPKDNPVLKSIVKDNFTIDKDSKGYVLKLKSDADPDIFISDVANQLNGLLTNVRKIVDLRLTDEGHQIAIEVEAHKRLSPLVEPVKSMLDNKFELSYREDKNLYLTRWKQPDNIIQMGLDLKGGMYQDVGVKTDEVVKSVLDSLAGDLEDNLIADNVNYDSVSRVGDREVEVVLEPDEQFELKGKDYDRLLDRSYNVSKTDSGYLITIKPEEVKRIKKRAVEQALETIRNRIDQLGVKEPSIQLRGQDSNSIIIRLPGLTDPDQARRVIGTVAVLNFQLVADEGSIENPKPDQEVLYQEIRDPTTKEVIRTKPWLLEKKIQMTGDRVRDSRVGFLQTTGSAYVTLSLDDQGKEEFAEITKNNVGRQLAIVLDGKVQSAPRINEEISGGEAQITGNFTTQEATELALVLRSGALPAPIVINEERTVGPSLGADSIRKSFIALCIGFAAVILFMSIYYELSGLFSVMALIFNLLLIMATLAYFQATLTLPGMAGVVLTIGMAVDANVLIFERIREEITRGSPIRTAINVGFKKATVTILDANVTTILAAVVLGQFGTGPIKGFAVTLSIGIAASMFTSIVVVRALYELVYLRRSKLEKISI